jgi:hypothetical protein
MAANTEFRYVTLDIVLHSAALVRINNVNPSSSLVQVSQSLLVGLAATVTPIANGGDKVA